MTFSCKVERNANKNNERRAWLLTADIQVGIMICKISQDITNIKNLLNSIYKTIK